ncbi:MAG: diguanylate cyclase [Rhodocyclales bacterium GWA2_65_19]|nr:MAG: diguanylate cyclase [Rhodocyclales bacterium GWA2_65_19]
MKQTDQTLLEQMRITEFDVEHRQALLSFTHADAEALRACKAVIEQRIDALVAEFYRLQTGITEIALLIGDVDTLNRLHDVQRRYVLDLFSGVYDLDYVNNRLRIGLVHKRIGVEPKLYLAAIHTLRELLHTTICEAFPAGDERETVLVALNKLLLFDVTLVFETYIRSLVSEIEMAKEKSERYARSMEEKVKERTQQLEEMSRTDSLTGLLNVRHLEETVTKALRSAQRRAEPVAAVYIDVNDFKAINDTEGHQRGDEILRVIGSAIKDLSRSEDSCFRYGGDEFCVLLINCRAEQAQTQFVDRLNERILRSLDAVSLSCGVAQTGPSEYVDAGALIRLADQNMYAAKHAFKAEREAPFD